MTVMVTDIDEPLVITGDDSVGFAENRQSSDTVHAYEADDPEKETVVWTLEGADRGLFTIAGGELKFNASPDYENPADRGRNRSYDVTVVASNKRHTARQNVTVTVTDKDEPGTLTFSSQQPQAGTALTARVTDPDAPRSMSWRWESQDGGNTWDTATGRGARSATYTPTSADGDNSRNLRVSVTYTDAFGRKTLEPISIANSVRPKPLTNSAPMFTTTDESRNVAENISSGQDIGAAFSAGDDDSDPLSYSLRGRDAASFDIDPLTGQLETRAALDYEAKDSYEVTVRATDLSAAFDDVAVTITVGNVEEAGTVTLSGGPPKVGTKLTARLTDPDGDIYGLTWQWQRSKNRASGWTDIFAATSETYTPTGAHANHYLRAVANYTDGFTPNTPDMASGTTLEIVEMAQQQQRNTRHRHAPAPARAPAPTRVPAPARVPAAPALAPVPPLHRGPILSQSPMRRKSSRTSTTRRRFTERRYRRCLMRACSTVRAVVMVVYVPELLCCAGRWRCGWCVSSMTVSTRFRQAGHVLTMWTPIYGGRPTLSVLPILGSPRDATPSR